MPDPSSIKPTPVALFEQGGIESVSLVFLTPTAAKNLRDGLESALATPEALGRATWPKEICSFPVRPQFKGREQFISFHIDPGKTPFTRTQVLRTRIKSALNVIFVVIGLVVFVRWLWGAMGV
jgi:hypothetical protein